VLECGHRLPKPDYWRAGLDVHPSRLCGECPSRNADQDAKRYDSHRRRALAAMEMPECEHGGDCRVCLPCGWTVAEFVAAFPDGASIHEVGAALGLSSAGVRFVEDAALAKLASLLGDGKRRAPKLSARHFTGAEATPGTWDRRILRALEADDATPAELVELLSPDSSESVAKAVARLRARGLVRSVAGSFSLTVSRSG
jgi:hypothetical protein